MKTNLDIRPCFEKVIIESGDNFSLEEVSGKTLRCVYHYHPEYEITLIICGSGSRLFGTSLEHYGTGDLILAGGNLPHHYASSWSNNKPNFTMSRVIKFSDACLGKDFFDLKDMAPVKKLLEASGNGLAFPMGTSNKVKGKIAALFKASGPRRIILFLDILNDLAGSEKRSLSMETCREAPSELETTRMDRALAYINENISQKLTLGQVSRSVGLAPAVFSRFFSKVTRKTFSRYVLELRISNACNLLLETSMSVSEICYHSGFNNLSNFNRLFKKVKQTSPRKFRNEAKQIITGNGS
jgi:AraC-like DNA-binding protein